jgi:hypothetical protein
VNFLFCFSRSPTIFESRAALWLLQRALAYQINEKYGQRVDRQRSGTVDTDSKMISRCGKALMQDFDLNWGGSESGRDFEKLNDLFRK